MKTSFLILLFAIMLAGTIAWTTYTPKPSESGKKKAHMQVAHLSRGDTTGLSAIREVFVRRNPGYDLHYYHQIKSLPTAQAYRIAFVQQGGGMAQIAEEVSSKFSVGDIIYVDKGQQLVTDSLADLLVFSVPQPLPDNIPPFIRPDWDENITDTPGGCATETNAYRRILLTWKDQVGTYIYHALNAHRVRIMDSFTHYHPVEGGFDEFYLVQMALPNARLITSEHLDLITHPGSVTRKQAKNLLQSTQLNVGDLVYLPRGVVHRGLGGVLAQIITIPGFIPGSEIGVDHHLRHINENLGLKEAALPYNLEAGAQAVIK